MGLLNQGATCYLNSLIQTLFMTPPFRSLVLAMGIHKSSVDQKSDYLDSLNKWQILSSLQKLFAEMSGLDQVAASTGAVTSSFGWTGAEGSEQQDIQEAMRVLLDVIARACLGLKEHSSLMEMFQSRFENVIQCEHGHQSIRPEECMDFQVQVQGMGDLKKGIADLMNWELLEQDNKYFCSQCDKKVDAKKGIRVTRLADVLCLSLNRFTFDFQKMDRVKVNDRFTFDLLLHGEEFG